MGFTWLAHMSKPRIVMNGFRWWAASQISWSKMPMSLIERAVVRLLKPRESNKDDAVQEDHRPEGGLGSRKTPSHSLQTQIGGLDPRGKSQVGPQRFVAWLRSFDVACACFANGH